MVEFIPDDIAQRSFRTALRGFDQTEVREFLISLSERVTELQAERDHLSATMQAADTADLKDEIETVSREIHSVLESARSAAETMRERAAAEAARWRSEAIAEAEQTRREAQADAEHLRTDAWTTSESLLTQAQREAARIRDEAEKESMRLVGESEREAHRTLGNARRESEESLRSARMEAEKLVLDARASHNEIIESANRKAEVAQERTAALEARRDELRKELDSVRAAIAAVESELDERREALGLTPTPDEPPQTEAGEQWVPGETVRVVRPGHQEARSDEQAASPDSRARPEPTPELRVLTPEELRSRQADPASMHAEDDIEDVGEVFFSAGIEVEEVRASEAPGGDDDSEAAGDHDSGAALDPPDVDTPEPQPAGPAAEVAPAEPIADAHSGLDVLEGLFARLRHPVAGSGEGKAEAEAEAKGEVDRAGSDAQEQADPQPTERATERAEDSPDLFGIRDEILLPIANRALRNLKRQLTEEQNAALESIRIDDKGWEPDSESLAAGVRPDLVVLVAESFGAGHRAAETMTGLQLPRPAAPQDQTGGGFADGLCADLTKALVGGRTHDHGSRQLASDVSRVFRAWRTDEAERRVRHLSYLAFNRGVAESLGERPLRWVVAGRGCAACRDRGGRTVEELPPLHEGCACTVLPAS